MSVQFQETNYEVITDDTGQYVCTVFEATCHGVTIRYSTIDPQLDLWASPIWTMREKGVALVDAHGNMVANKRRDR